MVRVKRGIKVHTRVLGGKRKLDGEREDNFRGNYQQLPREERRRTVMSGESAGRRKKKK